MNIFDSIQNTAFTVVANCFGNAASWTPANGDPAQSATVLYKDPTEKQSISDQDYDFENYLMEYQQGELIGLKESVDKNTDERVTIVNSLGTSVEFYVRKVKRKYDGKTFIATLNPVE